MPQFPELNPGLGTFAGELGDSICAIKAHFGFTGDEVTRPGSGFLIRRKGQKAYIATAGHVLFNHDRGGEYPTALSIWLGRDGTRQAWFKTYDDDHVASRCFVPSRFETGSDEDADVDFGLIRVDEPLTGIACFDVSSAMPLVATTKIIGYPSTAGQSQSTRPFHAMLELIEHGSENFDYAHQVTYEGQSGAPLIGQSSTNTKPRVFGLHIRGDTPMRAVRLSPAVRAEMRSWIDRP